jgi:hypothetical protein
VNSRPARPRLSPLPHPAFISSGPQLDSVIEEMEAGTMPLPDEGAVWRPDVPAEQRHRLARATGATDAMIDAAEKGHYYDDADEAET